MELVAALFTEGFELRPGSPARIDLTGVHFSTVAPGPLPLTIEPHLIALIWCPPEETGQAVFEVVFKRGDEEVARNVSPFSVEPGKFTYRLVRGQLAFEEYGQVIAHCRIDRGPWHRVPLTLLPPAE